MCKNDRFTHLLFPLGCQGKHVIHDSWTQLSDPGCLAIGSIPFVLEYDSQLFPLLKRKAFHTVAAKLRPAQLLGRDEKLVIIQVGFFAHPRRGFQRSFQA